MQEEGLKVFTRYLRQLAAAHAQEGYTILVEGGAPSSSFRKLALSVYAGLLPRYKLEEIYHGNTFKVLK